KDANGGAVVATSSGGFVTRANQRVDLSLHETQPHYARIQAGGNLPQGDSVRAIANVNGTTYIATYGYGVEKLQGSQRSLVWPESSADNQLREVSALGTDANGRLVVGTGSGGIFFWDGKLTSTDAALDRVKGDAVVSFLADSGVWWFASARGLYFLKDGQLREVAPAVNAKSLYPSADN